MWPLSSLFSSPNPYTNLRTHGRASKIQPARTRIGFRFFFARQKTGQHTHRRHNPTVLTKPLVVEGTLAQCITAEMPYRAIKRPCSASQNSAQSPVVATLQARVSSSRLPDKDQAPGKSRGADRSQRLDDTAQTQTPPQRKGAWYRTDV